MYDDGKHHLIFNTLEMGDAGEFTCQAKDLKTSCKLTVEQGKISLTDLILFNLPTFAFNRKYYNNLFLLSFFPITRKDNVIS